MTALQDISDSKPPKELFHYTSFGGFLGIAATRILWASNIHYLNDAKEFALGCAIAQDEIAQMRARHDIAESDAAFLKALDERIEQVKHINVFVASFSQVPDQLSQWRGYCPTAKGVSVGFCAELLLARAAAQGFRLVPAVYERSRQQQIVRELVEETLRQHRTGSNGYVDLQFNFGYELAIVSPLLKDSSFSEEQEWRLVSAVTRIDHPQVSVREGHARIIPYFQFQLTDANDALQFTSVIAGPAPEPALVKRSLWAATNVHGVRSPEPIASAIPFRPW